MAADEPTTRLFGIRIYPEEGPPVIVALLATSASEAEQIARERAEGLVEGMSEASATVQRCSEDDETVLVTFQ
jgi:hypothetical protein